MIQLPEQVQRSDYRSVASITKARIRRVIALTKKSMGRKLDLSEPLDLGFRSFVLGESNFKPWNVDDASSMPDVLAQNLLMSAESQAAGFSKAGMLWELILKLGFPISSRVDSIVGLTETYGIQTANEESSVATYSLIICLTDNLQIEAVRALAGLSTRKIVALDSAFAGNDQLKTNMVLQMKDAAIEFMTA